MRNIIDSDIPTHYASKRYVINFAQGQKKNNLIFQSLRLCTHQWTRRLAKEMQTSAFENEGNVRNDYAVKNMIMLWNERIML